MNHLKIVLKILLFEKRKTNNNKKQGWILTLKVQVDWKVKCKNPNKEINQVSGKHDMKIACTHLIFSFLTLLIYIINTIMGSERRENSKKEFWRLSKQTMSGNGFNRWLCKLWNSPNLSCARVSFGNLFSGL